MFRPKSLPCINVCDAEVDICETTSIELAFVAVLSASSSATVAASAIDVMFYPYPEINPPLDPATPHKCPIFHGWGGAKVRRPYVAQYYR